MENSLRQGMCLRFGKGGSKKVDWGFTAFMKAEDAGGFGGNDEGSKCHQISCVFQKS